MYTYSDDAVKYVKEKPLKNYEGPKGIDIILLDIDKGTNTNDYTLKKAQSVVHTLINDYGLTEYALQAYFSGTGYHIEVTNEAFGFEPSELLPYYVKNTILNLFDNDKSIIDTSIFSRSGIYRVANTINSKSGLYKIPLTISEIMEYPADKILTLATRPRFDHQKSVILEADKELKDKIVLKAPKMSYIKDVREPRTVATCIHTLYNRGPQEGNRHMAILRIAAHFMRNGVPSEATKAGLLHWNNGQLEDVEIIRCVENTYNGGYKYSCNDNVLKEVCNPKCKFYKHKDYLIDVRGAEEMQSEFDERMNTDYTNTAVHFADMLGLRDKDCEFYPGDLVTIFGPTGSNKTTLAHNIALGYDFANDCIKKEYQMPTLYFSLELAPWYMHRRSLQIASDMTKSEVSVNRVKVHKEFKPDVDHIVVQHRVPNLDKIEEHIREYEPSLVVVDYLDLVETPYGHKGEYEQINYISHKLSNMAVVFNIVIIQISQVSRTYSRDKMLDLYAGKGSGAIENASRKVVGILGEQNSTKREISVFKNTDGDTLKKTLTWTPSFRLKEDRWVKQPENSLVSL